MPRLGISWDSRYFFIFIVTYTTKPKEYPTRTLRNAIIAELPHIDKKCPIDQWDKHVIAEYGKKRNHPNKFFHTTECTWTFTNGTRRTAPTQWQPAPMSFPTSPPMTSSPPSSSSSQQPSTPTLPYNWEFLDHDTRDFILSKREKEREKQSKQNKMLSKIDPPSIPDHPINTSSPNSPRSKTIIGIENPLSPFSEFIHRNPLS
mmetsp:Transcript_21501/g.26574  ORF Transcript_21501/g.26574 Transcript_21501/m.26574 type:complete len:203 (-) Transcript_21501:41-649(-)